MTQTAPVAPVWLRAVLTLAGVVAMAFFFANVEIQIEGSAGWAANLPTWRIEKHWLLDLFWGGRAMTGYHAWVFPFMILAFHFPMLFAWRWSWRLEARAISCIQFFWLIEDFLWFILNPAYGWAKFSPQFVPWHIHWLWGAPLDYWTMTLVGIALYAWSWLGPDARKPARS